MRKPTFIRVRKVQTPTRGPNVIVLVWSLSLSLSLEECGNQTQVLPPLLPAPPHREKLSHPPHSIHRGQVTSSLHLSFLIRWSKHGDLPWENPGICRCSTEGRRHGLSLRDWRGLCLPCHFKRHLSPSLILTMCWQAEMSTLRGWCPPHPPSLSGCCVMWRERTRGHYSLLHTQKGCGKQP